jgi:PQQ-dependent catabolism-associated beta-propeller protein
MVGPASAFTAYVSNEKDNTLSVIDTSEWQVVKTIKVGQRPRGIAYTKDQKFVLVAVGDDDTIQMIDTRTNIDIARRAQVGDVQVGVEPEGMGISPDGKILVNTSETTNIAHFIDTATRKVVASVLVDAPPRFATFKEDGSELWVSSEVGGTVSIIDPAKRKVKQKIAFKIAGMRPEPIQPVGINITRDGKTGFVALGPSNHVAVVDGMTHQVTKYLLVGQRVWHMAFTPDEKYLLTTNGVSNDVSIIDVPALKVINTIQVGQQPWGITMSDR